MSRWNLLQKLGLIGTEGQNCWSLDLGNGIQIPDSVCQACQGSTAPPRGSPTKAKECNPISEEVKLMSQKFLRTSYGDQRQKGFHNLASVNTFVRWRCQGGSWLPWQRMTMTMRPVIWLGQSRRYYLNCDPRKASSVTRLTRCNPLDCTVRCPSHKLLYRDVYNCTKMYNSAILTSLYATVLNRSLVYWRARELWWLGVYQSIPHQSQREKMLSHDLVLQALTWFQYMYHQLVTSITWVLWNTHR